MRAGDHRNPRARLERADRGCSTRPSRSRPVRGKARPARRGRADAHRAVFYRQYAEAACVEGILRVCFLRIGDRVAAMQLAIEQGGGFWLLKVGYDARFASCSPGMLLMRDTIRYAVEAGLNSYEFLGRAETWTRSLDPDRTSLRGAAHLSAGRAGMTALAADSAAHALARLEKEIMRPSQLARKFAADCLRRWRTARPRPTSPASDSKTRYAWRPSWKNAALARRSDFGIRPTMRHARSPTPIWLASRAGWPRTLVPVDQSPVARFLARLDERAGRASPARSRAAASRCARSRHRRSHPRLVRAVSSTPAPS